VRMKVWTERKMADVRWLVGKQLDPDCREVVSVLVLTYLLPPPPLPLLLLLLQ